MIAPRFWPVVWKQLARSRVRTLLTLSGVATAMFLFMGVQAMHEGVRAATKTSAQDSTLVVYRENRFCPFTSKLPQDYARAIAEVPGVESVVPVRVLVSNCRASLDVVTFRGVPMDDFDRAIGDSIRITAGSKEEWMRRGDSALVGSRLAARRGLEPGGTLSVAGITVTIAGIYDSDKAQDLNLAYTHLPFIQRAADSREGTVTQFNVRVDDPQRLDEVAASIDALFATAQDPTRTWNEQAFTAQAVRDIVDIVAFARWLGFGALAAVFALVANAVLLAVQERVRDHAVLQTLGYPPSLIARMVVAESILASLVGGAIGLAAAMAVLRWGAFSFSVEGLSVNIDAGLGTALWGIALCAAIGVLAGIFPGIRSARSSVAACFRAV